MVRDNGIGIEAEFLPRVFERFSQEDSSASRVFGGLGIGLSIARHIVELHGGTIEAFSEGKNRGATFFVHLPLLPRSQSTPALLGKDAGNLFTPATEQPQRAGAILSGETLSGVSVLVVDDEASTREMLAHVLIHCGAQVETAASAAAARGVLARWRPDVLVCDIGMPHEDGFEFIAFLRALHPDDGGALPAIALTAYARADDRDHALAAGFNRHVPKPVAPADLISAIAELSRLDKGSE